MKKIVFGFVFAFFAAFGLSAQQITRFGVVDTARVYQAYFRNSAPVRNYESKKAEFQTEINKTKNNFFHFKTTSKRNYLFVILNESTNFQLFSQVTL